MNKKFQRIARSISRIQCFRVQRVVAIVGLFFINLSLLSPVSASAALFNWNTANKTLSVDIESKSGTGWSFDDWTLEFNRSDIPPIELILGTDILQKSKQINSPVSEGLTYVMEASGYSSTPDQTDDSPFITASGTHVRPGIIATNFLPMGTVIRIPELYGERTFTVEDRMNRRYSKHIDIWFPERSTALQFGRKDVVIEIVSL